jgi:hypothetical protein
MPDGHFAAVKARRVPDASFRAVRETKVAEVI